jgi:hypothetical protein
VNGKCIHCQAGIVLHSDGLHRSIGWEVPCQRSLSVEEETLMWKALLDSGEVLEPMERIEGERG